MGIFSDKCEKCGAPVKKRAKFCSKCGQPGPKAWVKCGGCDKWIGVESEYCPHCKKPQHNQERDLVANNQILRQPGVFIQRIDIDDIKHQVKDFLIIEQGTCAVFMENGKVKKILEPGKHGFEDGFLRTIFTLGATHIKSFFIIDSGDFVLPFSIRGMRSKEDMLLDFYTEVIFRFDHNCEFSIIENLLKDSRQLKYDDVADRLNLEVKNAAVNLGNATSIDGLIKDSKILLQFENELTNRIRRACVRMGLMVIRVAAVEFYGEDYEKLRNMAGDVEQKTREAAFRQRMREVTIGDQMNKLKTEFDMKSYQDQLAHEYGVTRQVQEFEQKEVGIDLEQKLTTKTNDFARQEEEKELDHKLGMKEKTVDSDVSETLKWVEVKRQKEMQNVDIDRAKLETYSQYSMEQLAAMLPADQVEQIAKARQLQMQEKMLELQANMTPEQILAMNAANSPEAAQALAQLAQAKADAAEDKLKMAEKNAETLERVMNKAIDANTEVAKEREPAKPSDINVIK